MFNIEMETMESELKLIKKKVYFFSTFLIYRLYAHL